jgi:RNA polymerase sigma-70 factor, ECF subfamily
MPPPPAHSSREHELYERAVAEYGPAIQRLARAYERDSDRRADLEQDIHLALWRSLHRFADLCSLRTWVYRVAHNVAATHVLLARRMDGDRLLSLDEVDDIPDASDTEALVDRRLRLERLHGLIARLRAPDRQLILLYLEGVDAAGIAEITGYSESNVATKVHRIKKLISRGVSATKSKGPSSYV